MTAIDADAARLETAQFVQFHVETTSSRVQIAVAS